MPVDAILVYGTRIYESADNVTYNELADMRELTIPAPDEPDTDVTPLADSDDARQFRLALTVAGELDCKQYFTAARMTNLQTKKRTLRYWRVRFPDSPVVANQSKLEFRGWLKTPTRSPATNPDDPITIDFKIKISGAVTFTAAV
jgi:hypothetical protein